MIGMRMMGGLLLLAAGSGWAAPPSDGELLRKCIDASGVASYQDSPCASGERLAWERTIDRSMPTGAGPSVAGWTAPTPATRVPQRSRSPYVRSRSASPRRPAIDACSAARAHRQQELDRVGLARSFDLLRRLDDDVARACRGR
jgi:hypothetical protein